MQSPDEKLEQPGSNGLVATALSFLTFPVRVLQPLIPRLIPLLVLLICIPFLAILSGAAGWIVWSNVPTSWKVVAFLQYGEASTPFATVMLPPISADQPYDVSLHLVVPATDSNYALGNFMATLKLSTAYNDSLITIRRPVALVPPRSSLVKQIFLGGPATVKLEIPLLSQFVSGTSSVNARVELGRPDGWKSIGNGQGRELSVIETTLKGRVRPRGTVALLARYPRLATFASTFTFFFVSLLVLTFVLFIAVRADSASKENNGGDSSGHDSSSDGPRGMGERYSKPDTRDGASGSSALEDNKSRILDAESGVRTSSLRKRRSSSAFDRVTTARVKIEAMPTRRNTTPPAYPKSPYPRPPSPNSESSSLLHNEVTDSVSPSDADAESP